MTSTTPPNAGHGGLPADALLALLDQLDAFVYVADMQTYELLFVNRKVREVFGDVLGKRCWQALQQGQTSPCGFCSNARLVRPDGTPAGVYAWQFQNTVNRHWYDIRDRAIRWPDGRMVRIEIALDITESKRAELQDAVTEAASSGHVVSMCAGCKKVRDRHGAWAPVEAYLAIEHRVACSHGLCPACVDVYLGKEEATP